MDRVKENWLESEGQFQIKSIAQHYGVYEHLFGYAYFLPRIPLDIKVKIVVTFIALGTPDENVSFVLGK